MRLIIICLCLCSSVSLVAFSRVGFPEDPLHILGSPRPVADREAKNEAKNQARFARLQRPPALETIGGPVTQDPVTQDDVTRTASVEEPTRTEAPGPEAPVAVIPLPVPAPAKKVEPPRKVEAAPEHRTVTVRAPLRIARMRMPRTTVKHRVIFVRVATKPRHAEAPGVRRASWAESTPQ
jgi:hypothetical protein